MNEKFYRKFSKADCIDALTTAIAMNRKGLNTVSDKEVAEFIEDNKKAKAITSDVVKRIREQHKTRKVV